jgi:hypothetical protein
MLVVASEDMEDKMLLLAFQLTKNVECEKEWTVFLQRCNNHIDHFNYSDCAIISDRDKGTGFF